MAVRSEARPQLSLAMLNPRGGFEALEAYVSAAGIVPPDSPTLAAVKEYAKDPNKGPAYFMEPRGRRLLQRADEIILGGISRRYSLAEAGQDPRAFFNSQLDQANSAVTDPVKKYFDPQATHTLGLLNEVSVPPDPGEYVQLLAQHDQQVNGHEAPDTRPLHELTRLGTLGLVAAELEANSFGAKKRLKEVLTRLNIDLFSQQPAEEHAIHALHDNDTNEVIWTSTSGEPLTDALRQNAHFKAHPQRMRHVDDEIGWVVADGRLKTNKINKAMRKALLREKAGKGDTIDPIADVPDVMGIKFVVPKDFSYTGPHTQALIGRVKEILMKRFGLDETAFREKAFNNGTEQKSGQFRGTRLMVDFPDMNVPLELMFHGQGDHLHNEFHVGEVPDETTGKPNGAAHGIIEIEEDINVLDRYSEGYTGFDLQEVKKAKYAALSLRLLEANRVDLATELDLIEFYANNTVFSRDKVSSSNA